MSEVPLPRNPEPRKLIGADGRSIRHTSMYAFPVQARVERAPDPDRDLPSDRLVPGWGGGILDSFLSKLPPEPTPPDAYGNTLVISILEQMAETHAKLAEDCRKLIETMREDGAA